MIKASELKNYARTYHVPTSTIERDYTQSWLLVHLPKMALKGGTGLRKAYFPDYRFSDDLDFTLTEQRTMHELQQQILEAVQRTRKDSSIPFFDTIEAEEVDNGYVFSISFRILRESGYPITIKIDITKMENEIIITPLQKKNVFHMYSDTIQTMVMTYSLEEIFAEKVRALFERTRPRDMYDIWYLSKNTTFNPLLLKKKCEFKKVDIDIENVISRKSKFERAWESSLRHQMKNLPKAEAIFENVIQFLQDNIRI
jgi:uncharacterized protein